ncbi:50S ribosomal protein L29 [candidate division WWE3 bacterium]|jgi:ribosomal protein L29|uniref:Large ribosomal subunit protein uL29 n=1 Tax=candidate division WWE3 bacterium TaxID=2053526 RepID=A0A3A4ZAN6_UNCKA|nr:MAG: 50S ribosomal protein L29 [candidate division WWE3 bacterium]
MKVAELREKTKQELVEMITKLTTDIKTSTLDILKRKEKNVKKPRLLRKDLARITTVLNEKKVLEEDK